MILFIIIIIITIQSSKNKAIVTTAMVHVSMTAPTWYVKKSCSLL
jgi:hypothetical protein